MSGNRTVFIGNIPYGVSEDVITQTLERVGQVLHFRLVYDKETGKPKGFGFAEYSDADQAAAAVRNLNDFELSGRKLRVDYSNDGKDDNAPMGNMNNSAPPPISTPQQQMNGQDAGPSQSGLPPLPEGTGLGPHLTAQDAISATVATIPPTQLLDAMQQMQDLARADPDRATQLLQQGPQLTYAILQILVLMKLIDPPTLATVIQQVAAVPPPPPRQAPSVQPPPQQQQQAYNPYPPAQPPYGAVNTPPIAQHYQPPQPPASAPPPPQQPDRDALLQQVLQMPQAQIDALPPADRAQIMALRQSLMQQYAR